MKKLIPLLLFPFLVQAGPHLCPVKPLEDNGCSINELGDATHELVEQVARLVLSPYLSRFRSSCSTHDLCYETIGKTRYRCDMDLLNNLRDACSIDPICNLEAAAFHEAVSIGGKDNYNEGIDESLKELENLKGKVEKGECVSTPEYSERFSPSMLNYLKETFKFRVGRYPTTVEEFTLLYLYELDTSNSFDDLNKWKNDIEIYIDNHYLLTTGPEALYFMDANSQYGRVNSVTLNASESKGNDVKYLWHMVHTENTTDKFTKNTPPAGGMMYFTGYLRVEDSNEEKFDYIVIKESFLVNSCTTTICQIEP